MNGPPLKEIDEIIYSVCTLCMEYEKVTFIEELKIGAVLARDASTQ